MAFNITDFRAQMASRGLAKNNLFYVMITMPNMLNNALVGSITSNELSFFSKTVTLPSLDLTTTEYRPSGYGKAYKRPMDFGHSTLPVIFMVDSKFGVLKFFQRWMQGIFNYSSASGIREDPQGKLTYEFEYHENYVGTIDVYVFAANNPSVVYNYKFYNAYPVTVSDITLSWENDAEIMTLPVSFEYDHMSVEALETGTLLPELSRQNGALSYISALNGYGQAINQLRLPTDIQDAINLYTNINTIYGAL